MTKKIIKPLAWNPAMNRLEEILRDLPRDRRDLFRAGLTDGTIPPEQEGPIPMTPDKADQERKRQDLVALFRELVNEHGKKKRQWKIIAEALKTKEVLTLDGKSWTPDNARVFWKRCTKDPLPRITRTAAHSTSGDDTSHDTTVTGSSRVTDADTSDSTSNELVLPSQEITREGHPDLTRPLGIDSPPFPTSREVAPGQSGEVPTKALPEWLDGAALEDLRELLEWWRTTKGKPAPGARPVFKGERRNTGIHCNKVILERAAAKAKTEKTATGGSLSLLTEWLLWRYIGEPDDLLES